MKYSFILIIFIFVCGCADSNSSNNTVIPEYPEDFRMSCNVSYVYDGDTFATIFNSKEYKVRILGIDCFETQINDRLKGQASRSKISDDSALVLGLEAKKFAIALLKNKSIILTRDLYEPNIDVYNRLLRHVTIDGMKYDSIIKLNGWNSK